MRPSRALVAVLGGGLLVTAGCTTSGGGGGGDGIFWDPAVPAGEVRLVSFDSCEEAAGLLRAAAIDQVGPWGFDTGGWLFPGPMPIAGDDAAEAAPAPGPGRGAAPEAPAAPAAPEARVAEPEAAGGGDPDHSGTNVHEAGVDEPDLVKTDGRRIVTVSQGTLRVVDAARRVETGALDLFPTGGDHPEAEWVATELLLHGDQALVLLHESYAYDLPAPMPRGPESGLTDPASPLPDAFFGPRLLLVDLTGAPRITSEYTVDGSLVDARAVGPVARVVVRSGPRLAFPELEPSASDEERTAANRAVVAGAELSDWLPRYQLTTAGGDSHSGQVDCTAMSRPASYTGTSMLTVLTFDLAAPELGDGAPVTVVADGDTVYSNGPSLYVASDQRWRSWPADDGGSPEPDDRTEIYKFDTSRPGAPRYVAAGSVEGWLINQYAMSEWDGHLRVATTSGETWWDEESNSESSVYVLAETGPGGGTLAVVGAVGGLGEGERIYSVRFTGPIGYVVTFRETDPLYTVDLRDPAAPVVLGELHITGYSAYLHPIDDDNLIGVGQEADLQGRVQGTQVSVFDVSDLTDPRVRDQHHVRYGHSEAEFDPHAFLWWPAEQLLVLPLTSYTGDSGALVLRLDADGFTERGMISHPVPADWEYQGQIRRSLVIEDTLWTVSESGLAAHSLTTLTELAWLPFT